MPAASPPCVIDVEASGFGRGSYPIELGYVLDDGRAWCTLVRPEPEWTHWTAQAQALHCIPRDALPEHGRGVREVAERLNRDLAGLTLYTDAWAHDYAWLATLFEAAERVPRFRLASVRDLLDESQLGRLNTMRQSGYAELGITRHRASSDARVLQWALARLMP